VLFLWCDQFELITIFVVFNLWICPGFVFGSVVNITFSVAVFLLTTLAVGQLLVSHLGKLLFIWCPVTENSAI
jgi:hypothetical protein